MDSGKKNKPLCLCSRPVGCCSFLLLVSVLWATVSLLFGLFSASRGRRHTVPPLKPREAESGREPPEKHGRQSPDLRLRDINNTIRVPYCSIFILLYSLSVLKTPEVYWISFVSIFYSKLYQSRRPETRCSCCPTARSQTWGRTLWVSLKNKLRQATTTTRAHALFPRPNVGPSLNAPQEGLFHCPPPSSPVRTRLL